MRFWGLTLFTFAASALALKGCQDHSFPAAPKRPARLDQLTGPALQTVNPVGTSFNKPQTTPNSGENGRLRPTPTGCSKKPWRLISLLRASIHALGIISGKQWFSKSWEEPRKLLPHCKPCLILLAPWIGVSPKFFWTKGNLSVPSMPPARLGCRSKRFRPSDRLVRDSNATRPAGPNPGSPQIPLARNPAPQLAPYPRRQSRRNTG